MLCHIIWIQASKYIDGLRLIPKGIKKNYEKIRSLNKDIEIITWDNNDILNLIKADFLEYLDIYVNLIDKRFISDLARLFILYKYGGIYIDIDQECIVDFNSFGINEKTEICLARSLENNRISNGFIYIKSNKNSFIKECIDVYIKYLEKDSNSSGCEAINYVFNNNQELVSLLLTENNTKRQEECSSITEFYLSFYFFNTMGEKIMRSRYSGYYSDKEIKNVNQLVVFI